MVVVRISIVVSAAVQWPTTIHRHQTPPGITMSFIAIAACISGHLSASRPLRPNVTSSIKPEVHNVAQRSQRRTDHRDLHTKFCEDWSSGSRDMLADRQTHFRLISSKDRESSYQTVLQRTTVEWNYENMRRSTYLSRRTTRAFSRSMSHFIRSDSWSF